MCVWGGGGKYLAGFPLVRQFGVRVVVDAVKTSQEFGGLGSSLDQASCLIQWHQNEALNR